MAGLLDYIEFLYNIKQDEEETKRKRKVLKLTEKEQATRERTETRRERESRAEYGGWTKELGPSAFIPGAKKQLGPAIKTAYIPGQKELTHRLEQQKVNELTRMNDLIKAKAPLTDKPAMPREIMLIKGKMGLFDKQNESKVKELMTPLMNWVDENHSTMSKYDMYGTIKGMLKNRTPMIRIKGDEEVERLTKKYQNPKDPRVLAVAKKFDDIISGQWLKEIMSNSAEREANEQQTRTIAGQLAQARADTAQASLIKAERGPEGRAMKTWITRDNDIITIPNNQQPPEGSVPYSSGMDLEVGPEGGVLLRTGVSRRGGQAGMTRTTQTALEKGVLDTTAGIERLNQITKSYKPEFLELGTKWKAFKTEWGEKLKGIPFTQWLSQGITPKDRTLLADFATFRREAIDNINRYIKEITGAQMSEAEANRLRKAVPDPGEGFFDGDSPTEFQAKWKSGMQSLKLSQARFMYLKSTGMTPESIQVMARNDTLPSLPQIKSIINQRDAELEREVRDSNPNLTEAQIDKAVSQQLKQEFGL